jgi:pimeloyl-ACP methyl ester carboxylesterase
LSDLELFMNRGLIRLLLSATALFVACVANAKPEQVGVVILHGKQGMPDGAFSPIKKLANALTDKGYLVVRPEMPWSRKRYLEGNWQQAMLEIGAAVDQLRAKGAQKIVIAGHSIGSPAALSYAAQSQNIDGVALMAPGHVPILYGECLSRVSPVAMCAVQSSLEDARQAIAAGKGDEKARFTDINQGSSIATLTTANAFLSYFDPAGEAEMAVTAKKLPARTAVLWIIGYQDALIKLGPDYVFKLLPSNPKHKYLEIASNHFRTPVDGVAEIVAWIDSIAE